MKASIK